MKGCRCGRALVVIARSHRLVLSWYSVQVLHSSNAILQLFQAGRWDIQQRLSHCFRPGKSMSFAAVHAACDSLSKQLKDLLRDPVVIPSSKVCHQPPSLRIKPAYNLSITGVLGATGCNGRAVPCHGHGLPCRHGR